MLGENETGKTSLVAKVVGDDDPKKGQGLEYHAINVRDEDRDEGVQMGVFIVDGDLHHAGRGPEGGVGRRRKGVGALPHRFYRISSLC